MLLARDRKRQRLPTMFLKRLLKSGTRFDGRKTIERACPHRDGKSEAARCNLAWEWKPVARLLRDFVHASAAQSCLGISVILVIRQKPLAVLFKCRWGVGVLISQRSQRPPRRDALHLCAQ